MKIRIKSGDCPSYLTVGKVYESSFLGGFNGNKVYIIKDDRGLYLKVGISNSYHLNGGSWEIVNET